MSRFPLSNPAYLHGNEQHFAQQHWGLWKVLIKPQPQLLYSLLPSYTRHGYATEAAKRVIVYAFETLSFSYLTAACDSPNGASLQVWERSQMVEEKVIDSKPTCFYRMDNPSGGSAT